jgi:hypothetical protein
MCESSNPFDGFTSKYQTRGNGSLSKLHKTVTADLLALAFPGLNNMFLSLFSLDQWQCHEFLGLVIELRCWLLDLWEPAVDGAECRVTELVGAGEIWAQVWEQAQRELVIWVFNVWEEGGV